MNHDMFMRRALALAAQGEGRVNPNPLVGAVIVKEGRILAEGYHRQCGGPHAEREALAVCDDPAGATLYVNLEPCCHHGRTPPCTEAILQSEIARVVVGMLDPNPLVAGQGVQILRENGVVVDVGLLEQECRSLNEVFVHYISRKTPFVVMKYAMTADGKIATKTGSARWISGPHAREQVHRLRNKYSAIMVGIGTVLADDPLLNCRMAGGRNPLRVICDSNLAIPLDCRIVQTAGELRTVVATLTGRSEKRAKLEEAGVEVLQTSARKGRVDLVDLMQRLAARGIDSILLEGGGNLHYSALEQGVAHKLWVYVGAKIFGGASSLSPVEGEGVKLAADAYPLFLERATVLDGDVLLEYRLEAPECLQEL